MATTDELPHLADSCMSDNENPGSVEEEIMEETSDNSDVMVSCKYDRSERHEISEVAFDTRKHFDIEDIIDIYQKKLSADDTVVPHGCGSILARLGRLVSERKMQTKESLEHGKDGKIEAIQDLSTSGEQGESPCKKKTEESTPPDQVVDASEVCLGDVFFFQEIDGPTVRLSLRTRLDSFVTMQKLASQPSILNLPSHSMEIPEIPPEASVALVAETEFDTIDLHPVERIDCIEKNRDVADMEVGIGGDDKHGMSRHGLLMRLNSFVSERKLQREMSQRGILHQDKASAPSQPTRKVDVSSEFALVGDEVDLCDVFLQDSADPTTVSRRICNRLNNSAIERKSVKDLSRLVISSVSSDEVSVLKTCPAGGDASTQSHGTYAENTDEVDMCVFRQGEESTTVRRGLFTRLNSFVANSKIQRSASRLGTVSLSSHGKEPPELAQADEPEKAPQPDSLSDSVEDVLDEVNLRDEFFFEETAESHAGRHGLFSLLSSFVVERKPHNLTSSVEAVEEVRELHKVGGNAAPSMMRTRATVLLTLSCSTGMKLLS